MSCRDEPRGVSRGTYERSELVTVRTSLPLSTKKARVSGLSTAQGVRATAARTGRLERCSATGRPARNFSTVCHLLILMSRHIV